MESTKTITVVTVLELGPFKPLMEETGFSEINCNLGGEIAVHPRADRAVHFSVSCFYHYGVESALIRRNVLFATVVLFVCLYGVLRPSQHCQGHVEPVS